MAWGLPVVSTKLGAEGIEAMDGEHLLIRDDPEEFASAMMELMSSDTLWDRLRKAGRDLIQARYSWDRVFEPLETALIELVS
jgi:glycosyltransferase involved in cell wall biosynthesis